MTTTDSFEAAWQSLEAPARRCLELAHAGLVVGGLAVGAVICDAKASVIAEGRNRAYDPPGGSDPLQATPLAHAEMNALARLDTGASVEELTIWSSQQPCSMCQAAIAFIGIGRTAVMAYDPSDPSLRADEAVDDVWVVAATAMFMLGPVLRFGAGHSVIEENRSTEPETVAIVFGILDDADRDDILAPGSSAAATLASLWPRLSVAAANRADRRARG